MGDGIQFKPLRIKGPSIVALIFAYTKNISQGIKKGVAIRHALALDYDIDQLGN
ncbi:hypothetical protein [Acinetobacter sp. YH01024]|uniref:hypothetical protein n=1 Tax=Acinetobacter sp. YH01024 TaxID=2601037 RepID=UPI0015D3538F|nr:hypothetical protein [Acinetobacter sp. YH01024]